MESRNDKSEVFSNKIRAGKRTYFFDVKSTRGNDYYITITESKRRMGGDGYDKHKIFLYKEDFNKFLNTLIETVNHVKTELLPDYNYDEFDHEQDDDYMIAAEDTQHGSDDRNTGKRWDD